MILGLDINVVKKLNPIFANREYEADFHSVHFSERSILCDRFLLKCVDSQLERISLDMAD